MPSRPLLRLPSNRPLRWCSCSHCNRTEPGTPMTPPPLPLPARPLPPRPRRVSRMIPIALKALALVIALVPPVLGLLPLALAEQVLPLLPSFAAYPGQPGNGTL